MPEIGVGIASGSRVKIEPVLEIDRFDNQGFTWSYIVYHAAHGHEEFEAMTDQQLQLWEMLRPGG